MVHGQTVRYNMKMRYGRGFTFDELKVRMSRSSTVSCTTGGSHALPLALHGPPQQGYSTARASESFRPEQQTACSGVWLSRTVSTPA